MCLHLNSKPVESCLMIPGYSITLKVFRSQNPSVPLSTSFLTKCWTFSKLFRFSMFFQPPASIHRLTILHLTHRTSLRVPKRLSTNDPFVPIRSHSLCTYCLVQNWLFLFLDFQSLSMLFHIVRCS
jgi:hypothetical protein